MLEALDDFAYKCSKFWRRLIPNCINQHSCAHCL
jgi:hypothetical protein